jgi:hypothetical protein
MKTHKIIVPIVILILGIGLSTATADAPRGLTYLTIGVGGEAAGMGEAAVARVDDPTATYWNPAGLVSASSSSAVFSYHRWIQDVAGQFAAATYRHGRSAVAFHYLGMNVDDMEHRTGPSTNPIGTFSAHDACGGLSYAHDVGRGLQLGVTLKLLWESIYIETSEGWAFDAGVQYHNPIPGLSLGAALRNVGKMNPLRSEDPTLPAGLRFGAAYEIRQIPLPMVLIAADAELPFDDDLNGHIGLEVRPIAPLACRVGYIHGIEARSLTAGFGIDWSVFHIDYGLAPFKEDLGEGHRFSLGMDF